MGAINTTNFQKYGKTAQEETKEQTAQVENTEKKQEE
jgi:hypothetical protein